MPAPNCNYVSIEIFSNTMGISLVIHIRTRLKAKGLLVQHACLLEIALCICNCASCHVDPAPYLDTLLIPHRLEVIILDFAHALGPAEAVKSDDVVCVQKVQPITAWGYTQAHQASWHLSVVEEARELLE